LGSRSEGGGEDGEDDEAGCCRTGGPAALS